MSRDQRYARYYTPYQEVPMRRRPPTRRATHSRGQKTGLIVAIALFFAVALYTNLMVVSRIDQVFLPGSELSFGFFGSQGVPGIAEPDDNPITRRINLLVMGVDKRPQEGDDAQPRADTLIIVTIDPKTKTAGVLGVPRDLYVRIPDGNGGFSEGKINSANNRRNGGPELVMEVIEVNLGIELDDYVVIDFIAFQDFIDGIGGIDIEATPDTRSGGAIRYANYSIDDIAGRPLTIPPGFQHMDGYTALAYSRFRGDSDFQRIKRQQQVIFATLDKAFGTGLISSPGGLKDLYDTWHDTVETSLSELRVPGLALLAQDIPEERITRASLGDAVSDGRVEGEYVARLIPERAQEIINLIFLDPRLVNEGATIEILNGSGVEGLAGLEKERFVSRGIPENNVLGVGNAPDGDWPNTVILVRTPGHEFTARRLAEWLGLKGDRIRTAGPEFDALAASSADIIVLLGEEIAEAEATESDGS